MFWYILAGLLVLFFAAKLFYDADLEDAIMFLLFGSIMAGLLAYVLNLAFLGLVNNDETVKVTPLASLSDGSGIHGSFFLGSGYVDSRPVFMYYTNDNGAYRLKQERADDSIVTYTDGPPQLVIHYNNSSNKWVSIVNDSSPEYEFQVPQGSVKSDFTLDTK